MKIFMSCVFVLLLIGPLSARETREEVQTRLDGECETARLKKLTPMRKGFVDECVINKELPGRAECERFYADYGNRMGQRAALFYDLPECVTAFEYQQSVRQSGR